MKTVLVTGSNGFIGRNLLEGLRRSEGIRIRTFEIDDDHSVLTSHLNEADIVFHLAGINRPERDVEFDIGNAALTQSIVGILERLRRNVPIVFSSSTQVFLDNPYGVSKKKAEEALIQFSRKNEAKVYIYRFTNIFGKWCRPNYNSVVATFCHNISHGLDIHISDPEKELELLYIDQVVHEFLRILDRSHDETDRHYYEVRPTFKITLGDLAKKIYELRDSRRTLLMPDLSDDFTRYLQATYLSYLDGDDFSFTPDVRSDERGNLTEIIKSHYFGQMFVSTTHRGIIRGNHYHNTKVEKFCVLKGTAIIRFRKIHSDEVLSYNVSGEKIEIVDIPPGYTHSIENVTDGDMIVLFWANQVFNPEDSDTYYEEV